MGSTEPPGIKENEPMAKRHTETPTVDIRRCECGCGAEIFGKKARFKTGHDAKLKSALLAEARAGNSEAVERLSELGWSHFLVERKSDIAKAEREAKKAAKADAEQADAEPTAPRVSRGRSRRAEPQASASA
jgi:hypothetical protein